MKHTKSIVLKQLLEGNKRFCEEQQNHPNQTIERREELISGQKPKAVILSCSDSRVPPEIIFDQGLGDLFIIRIAGNVVTKEVLASIEFAVESLGSELVMVLGHENCGAVQASLNKEGNHSENMTSLLAKIPEVPKEDQCQNDNDYLQIVVKENAINTANSILKNSESLACAYKKEKFDLVPAFYNMKTGQVEILETCS